MAVLGPYSCAWMHTFMCIFYRSGIESFDVGIGVTKSGLFSCPEESAIFLASGPEKYLFKDRGVF